MTDLDIAYMLHRYRCYTNGSPVSGCRYCRLACRDRYADHERRQAEPLLLDELNSRRVSNAA
jgi:hypothetical protein